MRWLAALLTLCGSAQASAAALGFHGSWRQGSVLLGHAPAGTKIEFDGHDVALTPYGTFVIGLDRDEPSPAAVRVTLPGQAPRTLRHVVTPGRWKIQRIDGLPPSKVNPPAEVIARIRREAAEIRAVRARSSDLTGFTQRFIWSARGRISSVFGSQRILDGEPKQPHYGIDVAIPVGTPVKAPADGRVSLVAPDLYFTGGTVMIDHGHGVQSVYAHLSKIEVKVGDSVKQGQVFALSGQSGRATGPNLHWGVSWFDNHVDPRTLMRRR
jgi:Membrane proteins related to metalloendopeptidases